MSTISLRVVPPDECLWGESLVWLIGAVVCLLAATVGPMSVSAGSGCRIFLRCSIALADLGLALRDIVLDGDPAPLP